jgi:hypothetical protein
MMADRWALQPVSVFVSNRAMKTPIIQYHLKCSNGENVPQTSESIAKIYLAK